MRAHQIMSRQVITIGPDASVKDAVHAMLAHHVSGLPVVDPSGKLVGIVSESDFIRRVELGTARKRGRLLALLAGADRAAIDYARQHGRKVREVMTPNPATVHVDTPLIEIATLMETRKIKRLPVMEGDRLVGIVSQSDFLPAISRLPTSTQSASASDEQIRNAVLAAMQDAPWAPCGLNVSVRNGVVSLRGVIGSKHAREAAIVAAENIGGVTEVEDCMYDRMPAGEEDYGGGDIASPQEEPSTADDEPL